MTDFPSSPVSETADIVARLRDDAIDHRETAHNWDGRPEDTINWEHATNCIEAADEIERLRGHAQTPAGGTLREVLERFAKRADDHAPYARDDTIVHFRLRDCRAAKAALADTSTDRPAPIHPNGDTVTVKIPDGYDSVWDFLNDCGLEAVTPDSSPDRSSK